MTLDSIKAADPLHPSVKPTPYVDVLFPAIPEYPDWGTKAGEIVLSPERGQGCLNAGNLQRPVRPANQAAIESRPMRL